VQVAALRALSGLCAIALSRFSTTLQDDERALAAGAAGGAAAQDAELALRFRMGKKRLLLGALGTLGQRVKVSA
jgi:hypothetical protein